MTTLMCKANLMPKVKAIENDCKVNSVQNIVLKGSLNGQNFTNEYKMKTSWYEIEHPCYKIKQ